MTSLINLVKTSQRTARKPCNVCGSKDVYWAVNPETDKYILVDANDVTRAANKGEFVHAAYVHRCDLNTAATSGPGAGEVDEPVPVHNITTLAPEPPALTQSQPVNPQADAAAAALQTLMGALAPKVDADTVREIVKAELDGIVFPTRTVIVREGQEAKPVDGSSHPKLADVITDLMAGEHVMMVGPAGTGKSHIAAQAAEALDREFYSLSVGPQTSKAEIMGYCSATGDYVPNSQFRQAFEFGGVFLFDEIDRGHPGVLTIMNAALANGLMSFPDRMVAKHPDFLCCAAGNTYGRGPDRKFAGVQQIDDATLDRFSVETIGYDESLEGELCLATGLEASRVNEVLGYTRYLRRKVEYYSLPITVGMRASVGMCRLLKAGRTWADAVDARVRRGLSDQDWNKISTGAPASA